MFSKCDVVAFQFLAFKLFFFNINTLAMLAIKICKNQLLYFIIYISFLVLVTNAGRIHLTKNKKIVSLIFNYLCRHHRCRIFVSNYFFFNINTLAMLAIKIYKNLVVIFCFLLIRMQNFALVSKNKIIFLN